MTTILRRKECFYSNFLLLFIFHCMVLLFVSSTFVTSFALIVRLHDKIGSITYSNNNRIAEVECVSSSTVRKHQFKQQTTTATTTTKLKTRLSVGEISQHMHNNNKKDNMDKEYVAIPKSVDRHKTSSTIEFSQMHRRNFLVAAAFTSVTIGLEFSAFALPATSSLTNTTGLPVTSSVENPNKNNDGAKLATTTPTTTASTVSSKTIVNPSATPSSVPPTASTKPSTAMLSPTVGTSNSSLTTSGSFAVTSESNNRTATGMPGQTAIQASTIQSPSSTSSATTTISPSTTTTKPQLPFNGIEDNEFGRRALEEARSSFSSSSSLPSLPSSLSPNQTTKSTNKSSVPENPGDVKNCSDFKSYKDAKAWFDTYYPYYGDVAKLDGNGDLIPCESLPGSPTKRPKSN